MGAIQIKSLTWLVREERVREACRGKCNTLKLMYFSFVPQLLSTSDMPVDENMDPPSMYIKHVLKLVFCKLNDLLSKANLFNKS